MNGFTRGTVSVTVADNELRQVKRIRQVKDPLALWPDRQAWAGMTIAAEPSDNPGATAMQLAQMIFGARTTVVGQARTLILPANGVNRPGGRVAISDAHFLFDQHDVVWPQAAA